MRITLGVIALALVFAGCAKKPEIQDGSTVKFNYVLTVDGAVVDSSGTRGPMSYVQGGTDIIKGLQQQMLGLHVGDKKAITVAPDDGYGPVHPEAMRNVPRMAFNDATGLKVGDMVRGNGGNGQQFAARVAEITADSIKLDMNHPLAGKTLHFDVTVVEITPPGKGEAAPGTTTPPPATPGKG